MTSPCPICELHHDQKMRKRYEIKRSGLWVLRHHPDPAPLPGWMLLDTLRHCSGPVDFTTDEAV
ncbi:MAG: diadenosine tetraphosphate hydrolase, partial [Synechococcus sp.]